MGGIEVKSPSRKSLVQAAKVAQNIMLPEAPRIIIKILEVCSAANS